MEGRGVCNVVHEGAPTCVDREGEQGGEGVGAEAALFFRGRKEQQAALPAGIEEDKRSFCLKQATGLAAAGVLYCLMGPNQR